MNIEKYIEKVLKNNPGMTADEAAHKAGYIIGKHFAQRSDSFEEALTKCLNFMEIDIESLDN